MSLQLALDQIQRPTWWWEEVKHAVLTEQVAIELESHGLKDAA
jgi:hypothetical protein